jgi:hypothetical protein
MRAPQNIAWIAASLCVMLAQTSAELITSSSVYADPTPTPGSGTGDPATVIGHQPTPTTEDRWEFSTTVTTEWTDGPQSPFEPTSSDVVDPTPTPDWNNPNRETSGDNIPTQTVEDPWATSMTASEWTDVTQTQFEPTPVDPTPTPDWIVSVSAELTPTPVMTSSFSPTPMPTQTPFSSSEIDTSPPVEAQTVNTPPALYGHKAVKMNVYRGKSWMITHGGRDQNGSLLSGSLLMDHAETWQWNIQTLNGTSPTPRYDHSLVATGGGDLAVLFGGTNGTGAFDGTFVLTASNSSLNWQQVAPECHPTLGCPQARYGHMSALVENVCFPGENCTLGIRTFPLTSHDLLPSAVALHVAVFGGFSANQTALNDLAILAINRVNGSDPMTWQYRWHSIVALPGAGRAYGTFVFHQDTFHMYDTTLFIS